MHAGSSVEFILYVYTMADSADDGIEFVYCCKKRKKRPLEDTIIPIEQTNFNGESDQHKQAQRIDSDGAVERATRDQSRAIYWVSTLIYRQ